MSHVKAHQRINLLMASSSSSATSVPEEFSVEFTDDNSGVESVDSQNNRVIAAGDEAIPASLQMNSEQNGSLAELQHRTNQGDYKMKELGNKLARRTRVADNIVEMKNNMSARITELEKNEAVLKRNMLNAEEAKKELNNEIKTQQIVITHLEKHIEAVKLEIKKYEAEILKYDAELIKYEKRCLFSEERGNRLQLEKDEQKKELDETRERMAEVEDKYSAADSRAMELSKKLEALEAVNSELSQKLDSEMISMRSISQHNAYLEKSNHQTMFENVQLELALNLQKVKANELQTELDEVKLKYKNLEEQLSAKQQIDSETGKDDWHRSKNKLHVLTKNKDEEDEMSLLWEYEMKCQAKLTLRVLQLEKDKEKLFSKVKQAIVT